METNYSAPASVLETTVIVCDEIILQIRKTKD